MNCLPQGWGTGPYGITPWGGALDAIPGGGIPAVLPFDVYCVGPCGPMSVLLTFDEVTAIGAAEQFGVDPNTFDQLLSSGGVYATDDVRVRIATAVPQVFTLEATAQFPKLPPDFSDLVHGHIFFGTTDAAGPCVGLFFSKVGIAYTGGVHHTPAGDLVLDSVVQPLANSQLLVSEGEYWTIRVAASYTTGGVYIYVTKTTELPSIGHQLRYVLPIIPASALAQAPADSTLISVRGTAAKGAQLALDSVCLGSGFVVPNLPPTADAGLDQAVRTCSIVQLDGSRSTDPEGAALTYAWRLIDAPTGSRFIFDGLDGVTLPLSPPTGFSNKFYAESLLEVESSIGVAVGDVLVVGGVPYTITGKGTDQVGFYLRVDGFVLPDGLLLAPFKLLFTQGLSGATSVKPTFYPDVPGLYKFDLVVFDGGLTSKPVAMIVNVSESPIPRGCVPDLRFLWNYLSNFWGLVEDRERITLFWSAMAQVAASELLTLWQIDYNKSLRDTQRTFQRRWLHYDPPLRETLPDLVQVRSLSSGCRTTDQDILGTTIYAGNTVTLTSPVLLAPRTTILPAGVLTPASLSSWLQAAFGVSGVVVRTINSRPAGTAYLRMDAPFPFTLTEVGGTALFAETANTVPEGTGGAAIGVRTYRSERSLQYLGIQEGDLLTLAGVAYRILRVTDDPSDVWPFQRVTLADDLPVASSAVWAIPGTVTSPSLNFYTALVAAGDKATLAVVDNITNIETFYDLPVRGAAENAPAVLPLDLVSIGHLLRDPTRYETQLLRVRRYTYLPLDPLVADIPYLQDRIQVNDDKTVLRRNIDFYIENFRGLNAIRFDAGVWDAPPPDIIWAETTYLDNRPDIEANFGTPVGFTLTDLADLPSNIDYLSAVRGLWYSYFNGPTLFNLRAGAQILLGLPFAEEAGTIEEIRDDFSVTQGRILIRDSAIPEIVRSYVFPAALSMELNPATKERYVVGDTVQQFAPLVTGVEVLDWVKDPHWFEGYMNQGAFFEVEKFHKFLMRVDSAAFNLSALLFIKSFVLRIKPTYTYPLFVVLARIGDTEISVSDDVLLGGRLLLNDGACFANGSIATMFDDPKSPGGGWWSQFDADADPTTPAPVFPTPQAVAWGYDKDILCPEDYILGGACTVFEVAQIPPFDSLFGFDQKVSTNFFAALEDSWVTDVPATGLALFQPTTLLVSGTITNILISFSGDPGTSSPHYALQVLLNGAVVATIAFTETSPTFFLNSTVSLPITTGDILSAVLLPGSGVATQPFWKSVLVEFGAAVGWSYDTTLPAGRYCAYKVL